MIRILTRWLASETTFEMGNRAKLTLNQFEDRNAASSLMVNDPLLPSDEQSPSSTAVIVVSEPSPAPADPTTGPTTNEPTLPPDPTTADPTQSPSDPTPEPLPIGFLPIVIDPIDEFAISIPVDPVAPPVFPDPLPVITPPSSGTSPNPTPGNPTPISDPSPVSGSTPTPDPTPIISGPTPTDPAPISTPLPTPDPNPGEPVFTPSPSPTPTPEPIATPIPDPTPTPAPMPGDPPAKVDAAKIVITQTKIQPILDTINSYPAAQKQASQEMMTAAYLIDWSNAAQLKAVGNLDVLRNVFQPKDVDGIRGSFAASMRFSVTDATKLTDDQKKVYFLQTAKMVVGAYTADNKVIEEQTIYLVEVFKMDANGKATMVDTHRSEFMRAGFKAGNQTVAYTRTYVEATVGLGTYDGKGLEGDYREEYRSDKKWEEKRLRWAGPQTSYTVDYRLNADTTWTWKDGSVGIDLKGTGNKLDK